MRCPPINHNATRMTITYKYINAPSILCATGKKQKRNQRNRGQQRELGCGRVKKEQVDASRRNASGIHLGPFKLAGRMRSSSGWLAAALYAPPGRCPHFFSALFCVFSCFFALILSLAPLILPVDPVKLIEINRQRFRRAVIHSVHLIGASIAPPSLMILFLFYRHYKKRCSTRFVISYRFFFLVFLFPAFIRRFVFIGSITSVESWLKKKIHRPLDAIEKGNEKHSLEKYSRARK